MRKANKARLRMRGLEKRLTQEDKLEDVGKDLVVLPVVVPLGLGRLWRRGEALDRGHDKVAGWRKGGIWKERKTCTMRQVLIEKRQKGFK